MFYHNRTELTCLMILWQVGMRSCSSFGLRKQTNYASLWICLEFSDISYPAEHSEFTRITSNTFSVIICCRCIAYVFIFRPLNNENEINKRGQSNTHIAPVVTLGMFTLMTLQLHLEVKERNCERVLQPLTQACVYVYCLDYWISSWTHIKSNTVQSNVPIQLILNFVKLCQKGVDSKQLLEAIIRVQFVILFYSYISQWLFQYQSIE